MTTRMADERLIDEKLLTFICKQASLHQRAMIDWFAEQGLSPLQAYVVMDLLREMIRGASGSDSTSWDTVDLAVHVFVTEQRARANEAQP